MKHQLRTSYPPEGRYLCEGLEDRSVLRDQRVLDAMSRVPRHLFLPVEERASAYDDSAVPIGFGQTISQPFIVALMTQSACVGEGSKVLEIGTGGGYQSAILAELGCKVFTIEIIVELHERASQTLKQLGYDSVSCRLGDGWRGWPEEAPFDAILITAAAPKRPDNLLEQLKDGGRMVAPIEDPANYAETLYCFIKNGHQYESERICAVRFVPLVGEARR